MFSTIIRFCATFKMSVSCVTALNKKKKTDKRSQKNTALLPYRLYGGIHKLNNEQSIREIKKNRPKKICRTLFAKENITQSAHEKWQDLDYQYDDTKSRRLCNPRASHRLSMMRCASCSEQTNFGAQSCFDLRKKN